MLKRVFKVSAMKSLLCDGLQQPHHLGVFSLCIILLVQPSVIVSTPPATSSSPSLVIISSPQLKTGTSSSSTFSSGLEVERKVTVLTPGQMVINAVPMEDRVSFLTYQLAVALRDTDAIRNHTQWTNILKDVIERFEPGQGLKMMNVPIYGNFATDLLQWLMEKFHLSPEDVYNHLRSRSKLMCTSDGVCYSDDDVVCFCCPF